MQKLIYFFLFTICFFTSCIPPQEIANEDKLEYTNQQKAELSVKSYLKHVYDTIGKYNAYGFGQVEEVIPDQITQLTELKEMRKLLPGMKDNYGDKLDSVITQYDTLIAQKEREIRDKKVRSFWKIQHIYFLSINADSNYVCEYEFTLDPNFKMYDVNSKMHEFLDKSEARWFNHYYQQYSLFSTGNDYDDRLRSAEIYDFFDKKIIQTTENKGLVLKQVLFYIQHIAVTGEFSNQKLCEALIKREMLLQKGKTYKPKQFSELKGIVENDGKGENRLLGYSLYHKYEYVNNDSITEMVDYFEFDPWLIMAGNLPVYTPTDEFFEK